MSGLVAPSHAVQSSPLLKGKGKMRQGGKKCALPPRSHEDTFTLTLNYKGEALDEFWIKRSNMPPWTSGLLSIMTLGSVT